MKWGLKQVKESQLAVNVGKARGKHKPLSWSKVERVVYQRRRCTSK